MRIALLGMVMVSALFTGVARGEDNPTKKTLKDVDADEKWIYDDMPAGYAEAKKTGKPLLVVVRCVP